MGGPSCEEVVSGVIDTNSLLESDILRECAAITLDDGVDDGVAAPGGERRIPGASSSSSEAVASSSAEVASLCDSANRRRDRRKVERKLRLKERGESCRELHDSCGCLLASGYSRVVYGDAGA